MTSAALVAAIRQFAPETDQVLAIAIANNALGYGRAYEVPAELLAACAILMASASGIPFRIWDWADRLSGGSPRLNPTRAVRKMAERIRSAATTSTKET